MQDIKILTTGVQGTPQTTKGRVACYDVWDTRTESGTPSNGYQDKKRVLQAYERATGDVLPKPCIVRDVCVSSLAKQCTEGQLTVICAEIGTQVTARGVAFATALKNYGKDSKEPSQRTSKGATKQPATPAQKIAIKF
jgi:hypothetical protein